MSAAYVDIHGPHKLEESSASEETRDRLCLFWEWSEENPAPRPAGKEVLDVTEHFERAEKCLQSTSDLLTVNQLLQAQSWRQEQHRQKMEYFIGAYQGVGVFLIPKGKPFRFCNTYYDVTEPRLHIIVSFTEETGVITLSKESVIIPLNCCKVLQRVLGPLAGGREGIAGSPRGEKMGLLEVQEVLKVVHATLR